jgi:nucleoside-diphosphate-sugar epimerase
MRVALTGAGGFVGTAARRALLAAGHQVAGLSRRPPSSAAPGETWIAGELADAGALSRLVDGADAIVHAAAWVHRGTPDPATREACFAVNLRGTERLLMAAARGASGRPFVLVSTTAVYGENVEERAETDACAPVGAYGESKLAAERAVLAAHAAGAVRAVVLRPAMVYGAGAPGNVARMLRLVRRGFAPLVAGGRNAKSMVHGDDLATVILRAIERADAVAGATFNVAGEPAPTMREVGEALALGSGRALRWIPVPAAAWTSGAAAARALAPLVGARFVELARSMEVYAASSTVRAAAVRAALSVELRDAIAGLREAASAGR